MENIVELNENEICLVSGSGMRDLANQSANYLNNKAFPAAYFYSKYIYDFICNSIEYLVQTRIIQAYDNGKKVIGTGKGIYSIGKDIYNISTYLLPHQKKQ